MNNTTYDFSAGEYLSFTPKISGVYLFSVVLANQYYSFDGEITVNGAQRVVFSGSNTATLFEREITLSAGELAQIRFRAGSGTYGGAFATYAEVSIAAAEFAEIAQDLITEVVLS